MKGLILMLKRIGIRIDMFLLESLMTISSFLLVYLIYIYPILRLIGFHPRPQGNWFTVFLLLIFIISLSFKMYEKYVPNMD